jgi:hypothetical protein
MRRIWTRQFPQDCSTAKFLVWKFPGPGSTRNVGSIMTNAVRWFVTAYVTVRPAPPRQEKGDEGGRKGGALHGALWGWSSWQHVTWARRVSGDKKVDFIAPKGLEPATSPP